jgi:hypothetical protein
MSEACQNYHILIKLFPLLCIVAFTGFVQGRGFLWCIVAGTALYHVLNFTIPLVLGNLGFLLPNHYSAVMITVSVVLVAIGAYSLQKAVWSGGLRERISALRFRPHWFDIPILLAVAQAFKNVGIEHRFGWVEGPGFFDAANYHVPRALMWSWHGNMEPYMTPVWQMIAHPFGGSASLLSPVLFGCGWLGGGYASEVLSLGGAAAVAMLGRSFGFSGRGALLAAVAFISFPPVGLRMSDVNTDIAGTFPIIAAAALFRGAGSLGEAVFLFLALTGLGSACKQYAGFVAAPIGLMLAYPSFKRIFTDVRVIGAGFAGGVVAAVFMFLSLRPVYLAFGDFSGGGTAVGLTNFAIGLGPTWSALMYYLLTTVFDPFSFLPDNWQLFGTQYTRRGLFEALHVNQIYNFFGHTTFGDFSMMSQERNKTGMLSILILPWLIMGFKKGTRWLVFGSFTIICLFQYAPLATNHVGARFAILPLAAFALLWGGRANTRPALVALCILVALLCDRNYLEGRGWAEEYNPLTEQNRDLFPLVKSDTIILLSSSLPQDAFVAGRLAQARFEYVVCPQDGDWTRTLTEYRKGYKWFLFSTKEANPMPGPNFPTLLSPPCKAVALNELRSSLTKAGWKYQRNFDRSQLELWTLQ